MNKENGGHNFSVVEAFGLNSQICDYCGLSKEFALSPEKFQTRLDRPIIDGIYYCKRWDAWADRREEINKQLLSQSRCK